jgi:hypothetical protein
MAGCAQVGPPRPPSLELPKPPSDLRANRKGNRVTLVWTEPTLTTDRLPVRFPGPTLICRNLKTALTSCASPVGILPATKIRPRPKKASKKKSPAPPPVVLTYTDTLPSSWEQTDPSIDVLYAVESANRNNHGAALSNLVRVPAILTLPPPEDLSAELSGDGVALTWTNAGEPQKLGNGVPKPNVQFRYRIYRQDQSSGNDALAGEVPIGQPGPAHFTDTGFEWEKTYLYRVTAVSAVSRPDGEVQVEGDDSSPVRVIAHDVFPPAVPSGLQAVFSGEGQKPFIDLVWAPVTSADLAGYNIYRASGPGEATIQLNIELIKTPSYRDFDVTSGKTYTYELTSVDVRANESQTSEPASELVP